MRGEKMLSIINMPVTSYAANCFLVYDPVSGEAALFDPSVSKDDLDAVLSDRKLTLKYLILTHGHYDHMITVNEIRESYPDALTAISEGDALCFSDPVRSCAAFFSVPDFRVAPPELQLRDGDAITLGEEEIKVLATPGHTPGCLCFVFGSNMITGDTIFCGTVGRSDLPAGDPDVLFLSLTKLKSMETDYTLYPGHGENTTLFYEKAHNPYLKLIK